MTGPHRPRLSLMPDDLDQVLRLNRYRRDHPGVTVCHGPGYWQAQIPEHNSETVITRYQLRDLLDKLDTLPAGPEAR